MNILLRKNNHLLSDLQNIKNIDCALVKKDVGYQFDFHANTLLIIKKNASSLSRAHTPDVLILPVNVRDHVDRHGGVRLAFG